MPVRRQLPTGVEVVNRSALEGREVKAWPNIGAASGGCAVKYEETEAEGRKIGIKSDTLI